MNLKELIEPLKRICTDAGEEIMQVYASFGPNEVEYKADNSPLTLADKKAHNIIVAGLKKLTPDIQIISEEHKNLEYAERRDLEFVWCVDPLDGTKEFVKKNGEFTVNIALIKNQRSILGVVGIPAQKRLAWAYQGGGAYLEDEQGIQKLQAPTFTDADHGLRIVASRSHLNEATKNFAAGFDGATFVSSGSSLKFLLIAECKADIYPRLAPTMEWDTAAAHCILEESGGQVLNDEDKLPLRYNKENLLNPHFIAFGNRGEK
jgi:3'(2'), 5'-bisphosphate nucleotidase